MVLGPAMVYFILHLQWSQQVFRSSNRFFPFNYSHPIPEYKSHGYLVVALTLVLKHIHLFFQRIRKTEYPMRRLRFDKINIRNGIMVQHASFRVPDLSCICQLANILKPRLWHQWPWLISKMSGGLWVNIVPALIRYQVPLFSCIHQRAMLRGYNALLVYIFARVYRWRASYYHVSSINGWK